MSDQMWAAPLKDFSEDKLNLESFADDLTNIIVSPFPTPTNEYSKVIALDSGWGTGKTSFINMWTRKLKKTDPRFICLTYNAWENDDSPDALVPILCNFKQLIKEKKTRKQLETAISVSVGTNIFGFCTVRVTGHIKEKSPNTILKEFSARREHKERLKELIESIRGERSCLLICIDELDRCRPTFAIETLEVVKHFFDLPHVIFVFSLDMKQLSKSIKTVYGDIDSVGYLQRFFDHVIPFPKPSTLENFLKDRLEIGFEIELLTELAKKFSFSLRVLNVICVVYKQFKTYTLSLPNHYSQFSREYKVVFFKIYLVFIALSCSDPEKYQSLLQKGISGSGELGRKTFGLIKVSCYTQANANLPLHIVLDRDHSDLRHHFCACPPQVDTSLRLWQYIDINIQNSWIKAKDRDHLNSL